MKKQIGFTLSEIILVLAIMGTLLAMTLPALMTQTNKGAYVAGLQKIYGMLDTATSQIMLKNAGTTINAFGATAEECRAKYGEYLEFYKTCDSSIAGNCWASATKKLSGGTPIGFSLNRSVAAILPDGTFVTFAQSTPACTQTGMTVAAYVAGNPQIVCTILYVDVNGFKGPNKMGKDIFSMRVIRNGIVLPAGTEGDNVYNDPNASCDVASYPTANGGSCAAVYLYQ